MLPSILLRGDVEEGAGGGGGNWALWRRPGIKGMLEKSWKKQPGRRPSYPG